MKFSNQQIKRISQSGSSLIGVAILTLAMGFIITGGIYLIQNYDVIQSDQKSVDYSRDIEDAIQNFVAMEGRYPCPAPLDAAPDTATFGKEGAAACHGGAVLAGTHRVIGNGGETVRIGAVPVRTLNISDKMIADGYNKRYIYAITEKLATAGTNARTDLGAITIQDENGNSVSDTSGHVVFALISPGEDERGAYDLQGSLLKPCDTATNAGKNCDFTDATFIATTTKSYATGSSSFTHNFAFHANAMPYKWFTGAWNACHDVCFSGNQERPVECRDNRNVVAADVKCSVHTPRPRSGRACSLPPCYWDPGSWDTCSAVTRRCSQ